MQFRLARLLLPFPVAVVIGSCNEKALPPKPETPGVVRVSPVISYTPQVLSEDENVKWEGEALTLRFADRVDREFVRIKDPSGSGETLYFGILQKALPYVYANGEIFTLYFASSTSLWVMPTLRVGGVNHRTSSGRQIPKSWEEFEASMEETLRDNPRWNGQVLSDPIRYSVPAALADKPPGTGLTDAQILSLSMQGRDLRIDYRVGEDYVLEGRLEMDVKSQPWSIVRAWKWGVPIDLEADPSKEKHVWEPRDFTDFLINGNTKR
jgi:hypothetical protein